MPIPLTLLVWVRRYRNGNCCEGCSSLRILTPCRWPDVRSIGLEALPTCAVNRRSMYPVYLLRPHCTVTCLKFTGSGHIKTLLIGPRWWSNGWVRAPSYYPHHWGPILNAFIRPEPVNSMQLLMALQDSANCWTPCPARATGQAILNLLTPAAPCVELHVGEVRTAAWLYAIIYGRVQGRRWSRRQHLRMINQ